MNLRVCYFGKYNPAYPRNQILRKGLALNGVTIVECRVAEGTRIREAIPSLVRQYVQMRFLFDIVIVPEINQVLVPLAWLLTRLTGKKLVFDPLFSVYDAMVCDRGLIAPGSLRARQYHLIDRLALRLPHLVLCDTREHATYFAQEFDVSPAKMRVLPVGADDELFQPGEVQRDDDAFLVTFFGSYIPLHGVQYIVAAVSLLRDQPDIRFEFVGSGQTFQEIRRLANSLKVERISFIERVPLPNLPYWVARSDLCLGIFGDTAKAQRVIPHKVYQAIAMAQPVLTGKSPAVSELFRDGEHLVTCPMADPVALAEAIRQMKRDEDLRNSVAAGGYSLFQERLTPMVLGSQLKRMLLDLLER